MQIYKLFLFLCKFAKEIIKKIMKPKEFKDANAVYAKDQPEYEPLPAFRSDSPNGEVVTCWSLSFRERLRILLKGEIWLCLMTFNKALPPLYITTKKEDVLISNETLNK